jgi:hypothetical protein
VKKNTAAVRKATESMQLVKVLEILLRSKKISLRSAKTIRKTREIVIDTTKITKRRLMATTEISMFLIVQVIVSKATESTTMVIALSTVLIDLDGVMSSQSIVITNMEDVKAKKNSSILTNVRISINMKRSIVIVVNRSTVIVRIKNRKKDIVID